MPYEISTHELSEFLTSLIEEIEGLSVPEMPSNRRLGSINRMAGGLRQLRTPCCELSTVVPHAKTNDDCIEEPVKGWPVKRIDERLTVVEPRCIDVQLQLCEMFRPGADQQ